ncbi:MAG: hypothetical protein AAFQ80_19385 [Cyanobacteria bacterium J06621_8]
MKLAVLIMRLLSISSLLNSSLLLSPAMAQCIQADISVQYNISGSREPTERNNDVVLESKGSCQGNVSVTTGVQGNIGGNRRVRQTRTVRHRFENPSNGTDQPDNTIQIQVNPAIDVYNAADNLQ